MTLIKKLQKWNFHPGIGIQFIHAVTDIGGEVNIVVDGVNITAVGLEKSESAKKERKFYTSIEFF